MKRRRDTGDDHRGSGGGGRGRIGNTPFKQQQQQQQQHRKRRTGGGGLGGGGGGLSLEAFVAAKSKPQINPAQIRQHREFYKNAKKVQKYKKLVKNQVGNQDRDTIPNSEDEAARIKEHDDEVATDKPRSESKGKAGGSSVGKKLAHLKTKTDGKQFKAYRKQEARQKGTSQMEKLREAFEKDKLEKEEQKREREKQYAEQQQAREKALHERKESKAKLRKKTHRGQPVMKHRVESLLETIQQGS